VAKAGKLEVLPLTAGLYQDVAGILKSLDQDELRKPEFLYSEGVRLLGEKGLLLQFLSIILDISEDEAADLAVMEVAKHVANFFTMSGPFLIASGILSQKDYREMLSARAAGDQAPDPSD